MKEEHIKNLTAKYYLGSTSLEEEKVLFDDVDAADNSIQKLSTFIKKNRKETPKNFNDKLWESFDKKSNKNNKRKIGLLSVAASIVLLVSIYIKNNQNEFTFSEKEALLNEAKNMFVGINDEELSYNVIFENELVIVYTKSE